MTAPGDPAMSIGLHHGLARRPHAATRYLSHQRLGPATIQLESLFWTAQRPGVAAADTNATKIVVTQRGASSMTAWS